MASTLFVASDITETVLETGCVTNTSPFPESYAKERGEGTPGIVATTVYAKASWIVIGKAEPPMKNIAIESNAIEKMNFFVANPSHQVPFILLKTVEYSHT